ncbi:hypothetical protein HDU93_004307 [Gonapodya sp. JEL0774]|nr:hypothetical protein HDU93_004307 [Gonapodya sp. JEL0774]
MPAATSHEHDATTPLLQGGQSQARPSVAFHNHEPGEDATTQGGVLPKSSLSRRSSYNPVDNCHLGADDPHHAMEDRRAGGGGGGKRAKQVARDKRKLTWAIGLSITFFMIEVVGAFCSGEFLLFASSLISPNGNAMSRCYVFGIDTTSGSLALFSDSFHLLSDVLGFVMSLAALHLAELPASSTHSYGYYRAEILGALFSIFFIWVLTAGLVWEAVQRILNPNPVDAPVMFAVALAGVLVNIILALVLGHGGHGHHHDHSDESHSHSHSKTSSPGTVTDHSHDGEHEHDHGDESSVESSVESGSSRDEEEGHAHGNEQSGHGHDDTNINISSAALHVIGDLISSVGVLIASVIIYFNPSATIADPLTTLVFSVAVLLTTVRLFGRATSVLMEATPLGLDLRNLSRKLRAIQGVKGVHDLHAWNLTLGRAAVTVHVTVSAKQTVTINTTEHHGHDHEGDLHVSHASDSELRPTTLGDVRRILHDVESVVCRVFGIHHSTIQVEVEGWEDSDSGIGCECGATNGCVDPRHTRAGDSQTWARKGVGDSALHCSM